MRRSQSLPHSILGLSLIFLIVVHAHHGKATQSSSMTDSRLEQYVNGSVYIAKVGKVESGKVQVEVVKNLSKTHPAKPRQTKALQLQGSPGVDEVILYLRGAVAAHELVEGNSYIVLESAYAWLLPPTPINLYKVELMQNPDWQGTYLAQLSIPMAKSHLADFSLRALALPYLQKRNAVNEATIIEQANLSDDKSYENSLVETYVNQAKDKDQAISGLCNAAPRLAKEPVMKAVVEAAPLGSMTAKARCIEILASLDSAKFGIDSLHYAFLDRFEDDRSETDQLAEFQNPKQFYKAFLIALVTYQDWERTIEGFAARLSILERTRLASDLWIRGWEIFKQTDKLQNLYPVLSLIFQYPTKRSIEVLALKPQQLKVLDSAKWGVWQTLPQIAAVTGEVKAVTQLAERYRKLFGKEDSDAYKSFVTMMHPKMLAVMKAYASERIYFRVEEETAVSKLQPALRVLSSSRDGIVKSIRALTSRPVVVNLSLKPNPSSGFFLDDAVAIAVTIGDADLLEKAILKEIRKDLRN